MIKTCSLLYLVSLGWSRTWFCRGLKTLWGYLVLSSYCIVLKSVEQTGQKPHGISFLAIFAVSRDPNPWLCQLGASWVLESDRSSIRGTLSLSLSLHRHLWEFSQYYSCIWMLSVGRFGCNPSTCYLPRKTTISNRYASQVLIMYHCPSRCCG